MPKLSPDRNGQKGTMAHQIFESLLGDMQQWRARARPRCRKSIDARAAVA